MADSNTYYFKNIKKFLDTSEFWVKAYISDEEYRNKMDFIDEIRLWNNTTLEIDDDRVDKLLERFISFKGFHVEKPEDAEFKFMKKVMFSDDMKYMTVFIKCSNNDTDNYDILHGKIDYDYHFNFTNPKLRMVYGILNN